MVLPIHNTLRPRLPLGLFTYLGVDTMGKLVYTYKEFIVIEDDYKDGHIIINTLGKYENHGHLKRLKTAKLVIKLMKNQIIPDSDYLKGTILRISLNEKYKDRIRNKMLKNKEKTHYININKGVKLK